MNINVNISQLLHVAEFSQKRIYNKQSKQQKTSVLNQVFFILGNFFLVVANSIYQKK